MLTEKSRKTPGVAGETRCEFVGVLFFTVLSLCGAEVPQPGWLSKENNENPNI